MTVVRYVVLPSDKVFNFCSPRWLPEVMHGWAGRRPYFSAHYEELRALVEKTYVDGFNEETGHYRLLEESIAREGYRNPILCSAGRLDRRRDSEVPPWVRQPGLVACEWVGGSRLWVAQKTGAQVPCVVNDHTGVLVGGQVLNSAEEVAACFADRPRTIQFKPGGPVYLNNLPYTHIPEAERYNVSQQSVVRRRVLGRVRMVVARWLKENDTA